MLDIIINTEMIILGSTGSIGRQAVSVALFHHIPVLALSANKDVDSIQDQARLLKVRACAMADEEAAETLKIKLHDTNVRVYSGNVGILQMLADLRTAGKQQIVQNAILGRAGLEPTLMTLRLGYRLALANKESLVIAGDIVMKTVKETGSELIPVDSEHSAIFQCLQAGNHQEIKKILLTASGGPFYGRNREQLEQITPEEALNHPTWKMGPKITIDSATLMNKGFEMIEAAHLFHISINQIKVLVHRESIVHSMVEFIDHSVIAEMSLPDMRECIQYAITYPNRMVTPITELDLFKVGQLTFKEPDENVFPLLSCAKSAMQNGGALPCVLNASNEVAVNAFLQHKISFFGIMDLVNEVVAKLSNASAASSLEDIVQWDVVARSKTNELMVSYYKL